MKLRISELQLELDRFHSEQLQPPSPHALTTQHEQLLLEFAQTAHSHRQMQAELELKDNELVDLRCRLE